MRGLPALAEALRAQGGRIAAARGRAPSSNMLPATEEDWTTEYLAPILSIKIVNGVEEDHRTINTYGSGHTDGIITASLAARTAFHRRGGFRLVLVNASPPAFPAAATTARAPWSASAPTNSTPAAPVGPEDLTSYKWVVVGDGHVRKG